MPYPITLEKHKKNVLHSERRIATSAIVEGQWVKIGASDQYVVPATANSKNLGIAMNTVTTADITAYTADSTELNRVEVEVAMIGICPFIAGGVLTALADIITDASGHGVVATGDGTDNICGLAIRTTAADGEESHCLLNFIPATD